MTTASPAYFSIAAILYAVCIVFTLIFFTDSEIIELSRPISNISWMSVILSLPCAIWYISAARPCINYFFGYVPIFSLHVFSAEWVFNKATG